jgi:hypothetical protein
MEEIYRDELIQRVAILIGRPCSEPEIAKIHAFVGKVFDDLVARHSPPRLRLVKAGLENFNTDAADRIPCVGIDINSYPEKLLPQ